MIDYFKLLRPRHWYKNLVVFLPLLFAGLIGDFQSVVLSLAGFVVLCLISSFNYIVNDIVDRNEDRLNPEKSSRPIASGKVRVITAIFIALFLLISSLLAAFWLDIRFFGAVLVLFVLSQLYSFWLKHQLFIDVIVIATNMTIRAVSGAFLVRLYVSPWLIVCVFFLAIFLALGKRHSEVLFLGENAHAHKKILGSYSKELTSSLMVISTTLLLMSYSLYSFMSGHHYLFATLPFALYVVFKYYHHIITGSQVARHTELIVKDWQMMIGVLLWIVGTIGGLYFA